jgi:hypothetical protein
MVRTKEKQTTGSVWYTDRMMRQRARVPLKSFVGITMVVVSSSSNGKHFLELTSTELNSVAGRHWAIA